MRVGRGAIAVWGRIGHSASAFFSSFFSDDWSRAALLTALLALSWWSTTQGLLALVTAGNGSPGTVIYLTIGFAVLVLTVLITWTVNMLKSGRTGYWAPVFAAGYVLLTAISVGFGFGFYWTHIESRSAALRSAEAGTEDISRAFGTAYGRLNESMLALEALADMSQARASAEAGAGGTCGPGDNSAGAGPRYRLRLRDAETMTALRGRIEAQVGIPHSARSISNPSTLIGQKALLDAQLAKLEPASFAALSTAEARQLLTRVQRALSASADRYEAFRTGPSVQSAITLLDERIAAGRRPMVEAGVSFTCPDPGLEVVMQQAADALARLPELPAASLDVPLGADATVAAFGKLGNTVLSPLRPTTAEQRLAGRDLVPLGVAVAIDLFILLLSVHGRKRPGARDPHAVAAWLDSPDALRHMMGRESGAALPTHSELLEHTFWWRDAYHLALPVAGPGEAPLPPRQRGLTLVAMVLADAGLLSPTRKGLGGDTIRERLKSRFGRTRTWPMRQRYDLYRFEENGLARMTSLLLPSGDPQHVEAVLRGEVDPPDWRIKLHGVKKPNSGRLLGELAPHEKAAEPEEPPRHKSHPKPSAYWRSLKPIPKKPEE